MALVTITRGPWIIDTATITSVTRIVATTYSVQVVAAGITYNLTLAEATQLNTAISSTAGYIPQIPTTIPSQPYVGSVFPDTRILNCGVQSVDDRAVVIAWGLATTDAGIVADIGVDALYADGSQYYSCVAGGGLIFTKINDVWTVNASDGGAGIYSALITQAAGAAPVATVLQNSIGGTITPARTSAGLYTFTSNGTPFTAAKTQIFIGAESTSQPGTTFNVFGAARTSTSVITVQSSLVTLSAGPPPTGVATDSLLVATSLRVIVYP